MEHVHVVMFCPDAPDPWYERAINLAQLILDSGTPASCTVYTPAVFAARGMRVPPDKYACIPHVMLDIMERISLGPNDIVWYQDCNTETHWCFESFEWNLVDLIARDMLDTAYDDLMATTVASSLGSTNMDIMSPIAGGAVAHDLPILTRANAAAKAMLVEWQATNTRHPEVNGLIVFNALVIRWIHLGQLRKGFPHGWHHTQVAYRKGGRKWMILRNKSECGAMNKAQEKSIESIK